jgi:hypothetical protein
MGVFVHPLRVFNPQLTQPAGPAKCNALRGADRSMIDLVAPSARL